MSKVQATMEKRVGRNTQRHRNQHGNVQMTIEFHPFSDFLIVVGVKAGGKTTLTIFYGKQLSRMLVIDPTWQMGELGYVVHYADRIHNAFIQFKKVVYQPVKMDKDSYTVAFETALKFPNYTLCVDELDKFARPRWYLCEAVNELVNRGRAQGIGLIGNTRRPHMIHNDPRSNADHVICFRLHEDRDVSYMAEWLGVTEETIENLPDYHSLYYNTHTRTVEHQLPLRI
jgi:hypothetical protein